MDLFPRYLHPSHLKRRPKTVKSCCICRRTFDTTAVIETVDHLVPRGWFNDPPPKNLPTWPACLDCQRALTDREERLRNIFASAHSHHPKELQSVYERCARSTRTPVAVARKMVTHPLGFEVPASIAIPDQFDLHIVFRKIASGLYWWRENMLIADDRFVVRIANAADFDKWTHILKDSCEVQHLGPEVWWMSGFNPEEPDWNVWLFNIFGAVPIGVWQGNAVNFPLPHPTGVVLRDDAPFITPGLINVWSSSNTR